MKRCENPACAMRGTDVETDRDRCLGCGAGLVSPVVDWMERVFGNDGLLNDRRGGKT